MNREDRNKSFSKSLDQFDEVRKTTEAICAPLINDDYIIQSIPDVSPPKWHLGHTSWFFETLILKRFLKGYEEFCPPFHTIFNSYYESLGNRLERGHRGVISRPSVEEVYRYRKHVNSKVHELFDKLDPLELFEIVPTLELGTHHEQQHQELLLTDILHNFWMNPLRPAYLKTKVPHSHLLHETLPPSKWIEITGGGVQSQGYKGKDFVFDNETPSHPVYIEDFQIQSRLVTNGEFLEFVESRGYQNPLFWLSDGWKTVQSLKWKSPLYWEKQGSQWQQMTLSGMIPLDEHAPVSHISFYEADAYSRWKECRLPTETEWEFVASKTAIRGNFLENFNYRTIPLEVTSSDLQQLWGDVWEWSSSPYQPYPGFQPFKGTASEYNGKFMCNQMVLRGGSCATPISHIRPTYRNFFSPESRWQFSGLRLALCLKKF
jgi:ergothioneine biosynthesis protein EgtB